MNDINDVMFTDDAQTAPRSSWTIFNTFEQKDLSGPPWEALTVMNDTLTTTSMLNRLVAERSEQTSESLWTGINWH